MKSKTNFKKLLSIALACAMMVVVSISGVGSVAFASENVNESDTTKITENTHNIDQIPIYIISFDKLLTNDKRSELMDEITICQNSMSGDTYINEAKNFKIELVPDCQRVEVAQNPIFQKTISKANDLILNGVKVNSINFYVNENPLSSIFLKEGLVLTTLNFGRKCIRL